MIDGLQDVVVVVCVKYFFGYGDIYFDLYYVFFEIIFDVDDIECVYFVFFCVVVEVGVDVVMMVYIVVLVWGEQLVILNLCVFGMLCDWGYDGVIIIDVFDMVVICEIVGFGGGVVLVFVVGVDLFCIGNLINLGDVVLLDQDEWDFCVVWDGIVVVFWDGFFLWECVEEVVVWVVMLVVKLCVVVVGVEEVEEVFDVVDIV